MHPTAAALQNKNNDFSKTPSQRERRGARGEGFKSLGAAFFLALLTFFVVPQTSAAERVDFNIAAQPLGEALKTFAQQANMQLLYRYEAVSGETANPLQGQFDKHKALEHLLQGTNLEAVYSAENAATIRPKNRESVGQTSIPLVPAQRTTSNENQSVMRLAQNESEQSEENKENNSLQNRDNDSGSGNSAQAIPEILVKGARTMNADIKRTEDDVQPYVVLGAEEIKRSGAPDLQSFLNTQVTAGAPVSMNQQVASANGNATNFSLRGLGQDETLILINGRRVASQAVGGVNAQADLGGVPLSAVERIEILPSTASGIFGGGATGGVINVILKQNFKGLDVSASFENTFKASASNRKISMSGGFSPDGGKTNVMIIGSYTEASQLYVEDRDFLQASRDLTLKNNPSALLGVAVPPLGATTNIRSASGTLQLKPQFGGAVLPANFTSVPYGYSGVTSDGGAALVANAGQYNLESAATAQFSGGQKQALVNGPTIESISTTIRRKVTDRMEAFAEFAISRNKGSFATNSNSATYALAPTAPTNPFLQTIRLTTPAFGLDGDTESEITSRRAILGVATRLGDEWHLAGEYSWSSSRFSIRRPSARTSAPALTAVSEGSIDLLRDTNVFPLDFSSFALADSVYGPVTTTLKNPTLRLGGLLPIGLPGGAPSLSVVAEYRREDLGDAYNLLPAPRVSFYYPSRHQSTRSIYVESRLPIVSERNRLRGIEALELQLAARNDHYTTVAANFIALSPNPLPVERRRNTLSSTDPTIGLRYSPLSGLTLRASYGAGFVPPNVSQLVPSADAVIPLTQLSGFVDPRRGNEPVTGNITFMTGGNPDLLPEKAKSWTFGAILAPAIVPSLRISADLTKITKHNNISSLGGQTAINSESLLPALVVRTPATPQNDPNGFGVGPIVGFNQRLINFATADIKAVDMAVHYDLPSTRVGQGNVALRGTRTFRNQLQLIPGADPAEFVGLISTLKWIANASLTWDYGGWSAGWQTQYYDKYWLSSSHAVVASQGAATVQSQIYHDVFIAYDRGSARSQGTSRFSEALLSDVSLQFGVRNVLNTKPPIVVTEQFGYSPIGDPRLARYYFNIQKAF